MKITIAVSILLVAFIFLLLMHEKDKRLHAIYKSGMITGWALATCPNVNQETIDRAQADMPEVQSCRDFGGMTP